MEPLSTAVQKCADDADVYSFIDLAPLPALFADNDLKIIAANRASSELFQRENLAGLALSEIWSSIEDLRETLRSESGREVEFKVGGELVAAEIFSRQMPGTGWLLLVNNISARRQSDRTHFASEKQKWKMQRTEALERLAGGIAHEFNNYLAVILLQTDMINLQLAEDDPLANRVNEIKAVANDAAAVVRQLLAFGRRQSMNPAPVVLNSILGTAERDLRALVGGLISVEFDLDPTLGVCFVDKSQIVQALMYITLHSREKMTDGGKLTFRTTNISDRGQLIHRTQSSGSYIQIEVSHTGREMEMRSAEQIFEPFFSAKGSKENIGLALATVYGIVKQSGGYIWVTSVPGEGTTFKIQFPRIDEPKLARSKTSSDPLATVLIIDDEMPVRRVAAEALRGAGYRVIEASSGEEAVETARTYSGKFDLILADYVMPAMNGAEACERIKHIHKDTKVIFISGDPSSVRSEDRASILGKPFSLTKLIERVSDALSC